MSTLKEIYIKASQSRTLPNTPAIEALNNALKGSEEDMEKAVSAFFAAAEFNKNEPDSFENHLLSEFIKEIKKGCSLPIQRITSELMKSTKLSIEKKQAITLACVRILFPHAALPIDNIPRDDTDVFIAVTLNRKTCLLQIASSTEIEAEFVFTQLLIYHEICPSSVLPNSNTSSTFLFDYWNAVFDTCARNSSHPNMPIIFLTFLKRISQFSNRYFGVITLKHALNNVVFSKGQYPSGLVQKICDWGGNNLEPKYGSDSSFLEATVPYLMLNCLADGKKIEILECIANAFSRIILNSNFADLVLAKDTIESIVTRYPSIKKDNIFRDFTHLMYSNGNNSVHMSLEFFFTGVRQCIALSRRTENFHAQAPAKIVRLIDRVYQSSYISPKDQAAISNILDNSDEMTLLLVEFNLTWLSTANLLAISNNPNDKETKDTVLKRLIAPESPESPLPNRVISFICSPIKEFLWTLLIDSMRPSYSEVTEKPGSFEVTENLISQLLGNKHITSEEKARLRNGCLRLLPLPSKPSQDSNILLSRLVPTPNNGNSQSDNLLYECAHYKGEKAVFLFKQMIAHVKANLLYNSEKNPDFFNSEDNITLYGNILRACLDNPDSKMLKAYFTFLQDISWLTKSAFNTRNDFKHYINSVLNNVLPQLINEGDVESLKKLCDIIKKTFKSNHESNLLFLRQELPRIIIKSILDNPHNTKALKCLEETLSHFATDPEFKKCFSKISIASNDLQQIVDRYPNNTIFPDAMDENSDKMDVRFFLKGISFLLKQRPQILSATFETDFSPAKAMARVGIHPQSSGANINHAVHFSSNNRYHIFV